MEQYIFSEAKNELILKCIDKWGIEAQLRMIQEECAELISAINHFLRNRDKENTGTKELVEEAADVYITLQNLFYLFDKMGETDTFKNVISEKLDRVKKRLNKEESIN